MCLTMTQVINRGQRRERDRTSPIIPSQFSSTCREIEKEDGDIVKYCVSVRVCVVVLREVLCVSVKFV